MTEIWSTAALWLALGLAAALVAARLRVATPLVELVFGMAAQAVLLTFLAGAELDPAALRSTWKEAGLLGLASFSVPLVVSTAAAWSPLLMSTGLTFGNICALFGVEHGIIDRDQYSLLLAAILASAVVPMALSALARGDRTRTESGAEAR